MIPDDTLRELIEKRELVSCTRARLDSHNLQGFPLAFSHDLLMLRYVYDFHIDGLLLIRRDDITDLESRGTDQLQRKMLEAEKQLKRELFRTSHDIQSFGAFLSSLTKQTIVIVENESQNNRLFAIGRVLDVSGDYVSVLEFSGMANWESEATHIALGDITCCQIQSNYINFYARYFERSGKR